MQPIRETVNGLWLRGRFSGNKRLMGICREVYDHRDWLWTFVEVPGIEPTNNVAELALRPARAPHLRCRYRKLSFGTLSEAGSRFLERMFTVTESCRLYQRSVYPWLIATIEASLQNQPAPPPITNS